MYVIRNREGKFLQRRGRTRVSAYYWVDLQEATTFRRRDYAEASIRNNPNNKDLRVRKVALTVVD